MNLLQNKVFPLLIHPWSEVAFSLSLFFPLWVSKEIYHKRILRQSFRHLKHFTNNQRLPLPGVKSHFDTAQVILKNCIISPHDTPHGESNKQKFFNLLPPFRFLEHELSHKTDVTRFLYRARARSRDVGATHKPSHLGPVDTCSLPSITGPQYIIDIHYL